MKTVVKISKFIAAALGIICFTIIFGIDLAAEVKIIDPQYEAIRLTKDTPFAGCNGAVIGADGALYVVQTGNGMVTRIDLKTMKPALAAAPYAGLFITDDITRMTKATCILREPRRL